MVDFDGLVNILSLTIGLVNLFRACDLSSILLFQTSALSSFCNKFCSFERLFFRAALCCLDFEVPVRAVVIRAAAALLNC